MSNHQWRHRIWRSENKRPTEVSSRTEYCAGLAGLTKFVIIRGRFSLSDILPCSLS